MCTPSAVDIDAGEQLLQGLQFLVGLLDGAVRLHVAGDVEADVVHQRDRVRLLSLLQRRGVLLDDLRKLRLLHQLWQTGRCDFLMRERVAGGHSTPTSAVISNTNGY